MSWWGWCIIGTLLLAAELFAVDAQFYLIFLGVGAVVVGLVGLVGIDLPNWAQYMVFAALSVAAMLTVRRTMYEKLRGKLVGKVDSDVAQRVLIPEALAPGKSMRIEYRGSGWTALNVGQQSIAAGGSARIDSIQGVTLHVRAL